MGLKIKHFVLFITIGVVVACGEPTPNLAKIVGKVTAIDSLTPPSTDIVSYLAPYQNRVNAILDSTLAYAPKKIIKEEGRYNTPAGNLLADIVFKETAPLFNSRTGNNLDFVLLNHGCIRSVISKGEVTTRTAFEVMPFENSVVVAELSGKTVQDMITYLLEDKRPHPLAGIQIVLDQEGTLASVKIQGKPLNEQQRYFVATSSYLTKGGDGMAFFLDAIELTPTDYRIRNMMIDYFKKADTIISEIDRRYYKMTP